MTAAVVEGSVLNLTDEDAETAVFTALGLASMCWTPAPSGVFDSTLAVRVGQELVEHLRRLRLLPDRVDVADAPTTTGVACCYTWDEVVSEAQSAGDEMCSASNDLFKCSRAAGHVADVHVANGVDQIVAVWSAAEADVAPTRPVYPGQRAAGLVPWDPGAA